MFVRRSTMDFAVSEERQASWKRICGITEQYGEALICVAALQKQLSAWILKEPGNITPEQMAQIFYAQDDKWQAAFFNCMQDQIRNYHDAIPPAKLGQTQSYVGVPAGEGQWYHMAKHLDDSGFETIDAMLDHAKYWRDKEKVA